jgi:hypothetical protein
MLNAAFHQHQQHGHLIPTPNNLPAPTPLSPAQAIAKAFDDRYELLGPLEDDWQEQCLAPDFRALCAELAVELEDWMSAMRTRSKLVDIARAALATPPPKPPTVMEILDLSGEIEDAGLGQIDLVRAALERWGNRY